MQPYCTDYLALLAAVEGRPQAAARLEGYSDEGYRAKSEGRERDEAAASRRVHALAVARIGLAAFGNARAAGRALTGDRIAAIAFAAVDLD